jgi:hypothetical protein
MEGIGRTHARILAALWALEGKAWLQVQSEIHEAYKELPFWILLAPDAPALDAHRHFWRIVEPELSQLGDYQLTVLYKAIVADHVLWHGFFADPEAMRRALTSDGWSRPQRQDLASAEIFLAARAASRPSGTKLGKTGTKRKKRPGAS